ncbi:hypothetical protein [Martelella mangrovi]|uniref:Uncharacterized protein n=1 Tax=Martelella mangrovi TaxID=1397477 RepID=A0ABV2IDQ8_9HYPH|nr:hypothetical protein [uncultured Martelella sp.]
MSFAGATIRLRGIVPADARAEGPAAVRAVYRDQLAVMNRISAALSAGGVELTGHSYSAATGQMMLAGTVTHGKRADVDDLRALFARGER